MIRRAFVGFTSSVQKGMHSLEKFLSFSGYNKPQWALAHHDMMEPLASRVANETSISDCLWLAVPKRKVTPGKKRMKTTVQYRIKAKDHIIVDKRTGQPTLRHKLPLNWKDYLLENLPKSS